MFVLSYLLLFFSNYSITGQLMKAKKANLIIAILLIIHLLTHLYHKIINVASQECQNNSSEMPDNLLVMQMRKCQSWRKRWLLECVLVLDQCIHAINFSCIWYDHSLTETQITNGGLNWQFLLSSEVRLSHVSTFYPLCWESCSLFITVATRSLQLWSL